MILDKLVLIYSISDVKGIYNIGVRVFIVSVYIWEFCFG